MPPNTYILVRDAFALTKDEKLNPPARKSAPGRSAPVTSSAVFVASCVHVPFPMVLVFEGVNLHSAELELVEQDPVYTETSPAEDIEGMNASASLVKNGRLGVISWRVRFERYRVDDTLIDTNCDVVELAAGRKAYATSWLFEESWGSSIVVGWYGSDWQHTPTSRRGKMQRALTWFLMMGCRQYKTCYIGEYRTVFGFITFLSYRPSRAGLSV